jgi:methyl-accepting chemotaxis protein
LKFEKIQLSTVPLDSNTADICGQVAIGCSETAATLITATNAADELQSLQSDLALIIDTVEADISSVTRKTEQARVLSSSAHETLREGEATIELSLSSFQQLIGLINHLGSHMTGFASAMNQVRRSSQTIDGIARTTNMLALNASIEAAKAGEAGHTFAVVADEVKKLAANSRSVAVEITGTVNSLAKEAEKLVSQIELGVANCDLAEAQFGGLQSMVGRVADAVTQVGNFNMDIADSAAAVHERLVQSRDVRDQVERSKVAMGNSLATAFKQINALELEASLMFDNIVHHGLSQQDTEFVALANAAAERITSLTEIALANGGILADDLHDSDFQLIHGSNPERFATKLSDWAEKNWQPILEATKLQDRAITSVVCSSKLGFLPTHLREFCHMANGDVAHDTRYCRNGRILLDGIDIIAKKSDKDYMMGIYRHEGDGETHLTVRNVYVPLRFKGVRWGDLEIAYVI